MNEFSQEYRAFKSRLLPQIDRFFTHGTYILGSQVQAFEERFAEYVETNYSIGVANGLEAIQIALMGLGIKKGDEVITVSNTDAATVLAILFTGATPVFVDVDKYFHMDASLLEAAINQRTRVILPVHLYGQMADMEKIQNIAQKHKIWLVEDACQAHGATFCGKKAGAFGQVSAFSFYPTKNLGAAGDAGAIVTNSIALAKKCRMLRNRGSLVRAVHKTIGLNSRLDELQATILLVKLAKLDAMNKKRRILADHYKQQLANVDGIILPDERKNAVSAYHLFVVQAKQREKLRQYLAKKGITTLVHYPVPLHRQSPFRNYARSPLPKTDAYAKQILSLPIHPFMSIEDVHRVAMCIKRFY